MGPNSSFGYKWAPEVEQVAGDVFSFFQSSDIFISSSDAGKSLIT